MNLIVLNDLLETSSDQRIIGPMQRAGSSLHNAPPFDKFQRKYLPTSIRPAWFPHSVKSMPETASSRKRSGIQRVSGLSGRIVSFKPNIFRGLCRSLGQNKIICRGLGCHCINYSLTDTRLTMTFYVLSYTSSRKNLCFFVHTIEKIA